LADHDAPPNHPVGCFNGENEMSTHNKTDACVDLKTRIPELPGIMRRHGWSVAPRLMDRWFNLGANSVPKHGVHDTMTVKMEWVLIFPIAVVAYNTAKTERVWVNEKAQGVIIKKLIDRESRLPKKVGDKLEIGNVGEGQPHHPGNVLQFHKDWQIQLREVKQSLINPQINDLYGALGDFYFYYLVKGWVERIEDKGGQPRYRVTINKVGVYVMDEYDFNDRRALATFSKFSRLLSQPLGSWGCNPLYIGNGLKVQGSSKRHYVTNRDFRDWREKHGRGRGGDFMVFSDIRRFDTNDSFEFPK
jgi:hypothetical protein